MNKTFLFFLILLPAFVWTQPDMSKKLRQVTYSVSRSSEKHSVWVQFSKQLDYESIAKLFERKHYSIHQRRNYILRESKTIHKQSMLQLEHAMHGVEILQSNWLGNSAVLRINTYEIQYLANQNWLKWMELADEKTIEVEEFGEVEGQPSSAESINGNEPGLRAIGAPYLWKKGYTGHGRKALIMDTGNWIKHPAIKKNWNGNYRPLNESWFGFDSPVPRDKPRSHGTHVCGIVMGLQHATHDTIGVAFNAKYLAADPVSSGNPSERKGLYNIVRAFEWAIDPDGDTNTISDMPDVINNSWGHTIDTSEHICTNPFGDVVEACQLAGIAVVWSAGNNGPNSQTIGAPATITRNPYLVFTVGAIDANNSAYPIANFSSRGPTYCLNGNDSIKPEVVAPGVAVRSSVDTNGYALYQGTSMAGPHVAGAVLLLKEAFPNLPGQKLLEALYQSAGDLGAIGEDNDYGNGLIQVDSAFHWLSKNYVPDTPKIFDEDLEILFAGFKNPGPTCDENKEATFWIYNRGNRTAKADDLKVVYENYGGGNKSESIASDLSPGDSMELRYEIPFNSKGKSGVIANIVSTSGYRDDPTNNYAAAEWHNFNSVMMPYAEYFESGAKDWYVENPDNDHTWNMRNWDKGGIQFRAFQLEFSAMNTRNEQKDYATSPRIQVAQYENLKLEFEYAYTSKVSQVFPDTFKIWISNGCDTNWQKVFEKGGADLATRADTTGLFIPLSDEWRKDTIDLSQFKGSKEIRIRLGGVNMFGNNLYVNYVKVSGDNLAAMNHTDLPTFTMYPNPVSDNLTIENTSGSYQILDVQGRIVQHGQINNNIKVERLSKGVYLLHIEGHRPVRFIKE